MVSSRVVGAGAFVVIGVLLFAAALFMIGSRRMLFEDRFPVYTEFAKLGQLEVGAQVRVAGADAGEVEAIEVPRRPSDKFRGRMLVTDKFHRLLRTDSVATSQTEGLVGAVFVNITPGTDQAPEVKDEGTIPGRDPFDMADLLQQMSQTVATVNQTVESLRGDITTAVKEISLTAQDAHALLRDIQPDLNAIARNGSQASADAAQVMASIKEGRGTIGKLINDDTLYTKANDIADQTKVVLDNMREVSTEARRAIADFRSPDGPAQGLVADMRSTLAQAREATGDLADNMEALKHNFLLRGFFNKRGYYDLDDISPADYRNGVLENGKRKAMRIWLDADVLFQRGPDGSEILTDGGRARLDSAMATYLSYVPANPLVVEGYATEGTTSEKYQQSRLRAGIVRQYLLGRYELTTQTTGYIGLASQAPGSPRADTWDGVAITLFLDRDALQFVRQPRTREPARPLDSQATK